MTELEPVYLRSTVKLEPTVFRWPAWPHLIAPAQHALNLAHRHLPNLRYFLAQPSVHTAASRDPAMFGGPLACLSESDLGAVKDLVADIELRCAPLLRFAQSWRTFEKLLQNTANGLCLDDLYKKVPECLSGLLEMSYDTNCRPDLKVQEELLYSGLDNEFCQELCLHEVADCERPFFMTTPLLDDPRRVFLKLKFSDERIDALASMRISAKPLNQIFGHLGLQEGLSERMQGFFSSHSPVRIQPEYEGGEVRLRYFGHACILIQTSAVSLLIDPTTAFDRNDTEAKLTFDDLPDWIDYVVLTHGHPDHCYPELLIQLRSRVGEIIVPRNDAGNIADPSLKLLLGRLGYRRIRVMDPFDVVKTVDGEIQSLPFLGEHAGLNIACKQCIAVRARGKQFVFLADSVSVEDAFYRHLSKRIGSVDALFIGLECQGAPLTWLYGPLLTTVPSRRIDESRRLSASNCEMAWRAAQGLGASRVYIYAMGQEAWMRGLMGLQYQADSVQLRESQAFIEKCTGAGLMAEKLHGCREMMF